VQLWLHLHCCADSLDLLPAVQVRSYQIIQEQLSAPGGFYVATQRWAFKVRLFL
jgi:hypothetical protein